MQNLTLFRSNSTMDEAIDLETFFQLVSSGSLDELKEIFIDIEPEEAFKIANTYNSKGETPLLVAIKGNHYEMVKHLVENLKASIYQLGRFIWKEWDYTQVSPLFAGILCDMSDEYLITNFLIGQDLIQNESPGLVDLIVSAASTHICKIGMLKLLGAAYILSEQESELLNGPFTRAFQFGMQFWTKATSLSLNGNSTSPFMKNLHHSAEYAQEIFENASEFTTEEELQELYDRPRSVFHLQTQALLIIQRVMSEHHPHPFFLLRLIDYAFVWFLDQELYFRALNVVMLVLKELQATKWEDDIDSEWPFNIVESAVVLLDCCLLEEKQILPPNSYSNLPFPTIMEALQCFSDFHTRLLELNSAKVPKFLKLTIQNNVSLIVDLPKYFNVGGKDGEFARWLYRYTKDIKGHPGGPTLLHQVCRLHHLENDAIRLLLETGSDADATDENGATPLHVLSMVPYEKPFNGAAVKLLLDAGCHLDRPNVRGVTPLQNFTCRLAKEDPADPSLNAICKTVLPLKCYCAQVIRRNELPFKSQIPATLKSFVEKH